MGTQAVPERLFYNFCLECHIPDDHLLRRIDRFLDLSDARQKLKSFYGSIDRPLIDPERMIRMLIVGYRLGTASTISQPSSWPAPVRLEDFAYSPRALLLHGDE